MSSPATVFIIDDDADMRNATQRLLKSGGLSAEVFAAPQPIA
jgi:FixJ family two-component response regulator